MDKGRSRPAGGRKRIGKPTGRPRKRLDQKGAPGEFKKRAHESADEKPSSQEIISYTPGRKSAGVKRKTVNRPGEEGLIRLNKYIANAGVCSRRDADKLIEAGAIKVNGKVVTELGTKISKEDKVQYGDTTLKTERNVYILLNKPKGYITTSDDPLNRKTVMSLVRNAAKERLFPVGRLDRNTSGLLLLTNDGDMARQLMHPSQRIDKIYHVMLDKVLSKNDMASIISGFELDDGFIQVDEISYVRGAETKKEIGIRLHSGKNRIIRRIFEHLGYRIIKLDRVIFAGLTKKDLSRGHWRFLKQEELNMLKGLRKK